MIRTLFKRYTIILSQPSIHIKNWAKKTDADKEELATILYTYYLVLKRLPGEYDDKISYDEKYLDDCLEQIRHGAEKVIDY